MLCLWFQNTEPLFSQYIVKHALYWEQAVRSEFDYYSKESTIFEIKFISIGISLLLSSSMLSDIPQNSANYW